MPDTANAPLSDENAKEFSLLDRYWCAANYLSVGQIYLLGNPLLREPLAPGAHQAAIAGSLGDNARS